MKGAGVRSNHGRVDVGELSTSGVGEGVGAEWVGGILVGDLAADGEAFNSGVCEGAGVEVAASVADGVNVTTAVPVAGGCVGGWAHPTRQAAAAISRQAKTVIILERVNTVLGFLHAVSGYRGDHDWRRLVQGKFSYLVMIDRYTGKLICFPTGLCASITTGVSFSSDM